MTPTKDSTLQEKGDSVAKKSKCPLKFSSSGRKIVISKKNLTTSSDEQPMRKPKSKFPSVGKGIEELRDLVQKNPALASMIKSSSEIITPVQTVKRKKLKAKMAALLFRVMQKCPSFPEPESQAAFKLEMIEALRNAKQRYRNSLKQNNSRRKQKPEQEIQVECDFLSEEDDEENGSVYGSNNSNSEHEDVQLSQDRQIDIENRQSERNDSSSNESDA